jgi:Phage integrase, N-terminal SAM-like domain
MTRHPSHRPVSALRARMIEDMRVRGFTEKTRNDYVRNVRAFAAFIGRSPDTATAEDLRRFQLHQTQIGMQPPSINSAVAALRLVLSRSVLEIDGAVSGRMRIRGQAARSIGLSASFWFRVCHPSTLRMVI